MVGTKVPQHGQLVAPSVMSLVQRILALWSWLLNSLLPCDFGQVVS
jgi:hypothetical protein